MSEKELDPEGSEFQPLRAIYDPAFEVSDNVVVQDNVEKCIAVIEGRVRTKKVVDQKDVKGEEEELKLERQFKPEQLAQPTRPRKVKKGVLDRMKEVEGPLGGLRRLMEHGTKARVWTRGVQGIRGVATGFIVAFDKHWNLALRDVEEQFTRRRTAKVPALGQSNHQLKKKDHLKEGKRREDEKMGESVVRVVQVMRKVEVCIRHVPQVLLRGEHVVMVAAALPS